MASQRVIADRYQILDLIGQGGSGTVHSATDRHTDEVVALKLLDRIQTSKPDIRRFRREFRLLSNLEHPHIISVKDAGTDGEVMYFTMEHVQGPSLAEVLSDPDGALATSLCDDPDLVRLLICQLSSGLAHIHEQGMVHRDLKPENILLDLDGPRGEEAPFHAVILDLGLARFKDNVGESVTRSGDIVGTVHYMSPEQVRSIHVDGRSDLYSLGAILYEILTGNKPFTGDSALSVAHKHINELPIPTRVYSLEVPHDLQLVAMRLLEKEPARRYRSAADLLADL
ncbi:MAG: serine/threonine-protein kinase [Candidatus Latescibacteria bacterium]|nr:serine/threonine-protein kinase [Candidatus Latescibacterota bacterium]